MSQRTNGHKTYAKEEHLCMPGISILIVDDDKLLVEKLEKTMNWELLNISEVFTAYNIRQARSLIKEYPIQILLCDVDMPQGSGLELLEWIREQQFDIECAFLSSYANFAYAQMAVRFSASEYLLKPISNADLARALARIVSIVQKKRNTVELQRAHPRVNMWENLLLRRVPEDLCIREAVENHVCLPEERFCLVLVKILESSSKETERKDIAIFDFAIRNITSEFFRDGGRNGNAMESVVHISDLEWMIVLHISDGVSGSVTEEQIQELTAHLKKGSGRQMGVYLGRITEFKTIAKSRERLESMEQKAVLDEDKILCEDNWAAQEKSYAAAPWNVWEKEMLQPDGLRLVSDKILEYVEKRRQDGGWRKDLLAGFLHELMRWLYKYLNRCDFDFANLFDEREFSGYENAAKESVTGVKEFVQYIFEKLQGSKGAQENQEDVIRKLKNYIEHHLGENLSRTVLAQEVFLSEGYISRIFLKETGVSLPNYIAERRMEKAKEYLEYSGLPVSRIATEVGYNNFSYFSKTFRDLVGCTPNEYRNNFNKNRH